MDANKNDRGFNFVMNVLGAVMLAIILFVLWFVIIASLSNPRMVALGKVFLIPKGFNLNAYAALLKQADIWIGYKNSIFYTILGTMMTTFTTLITAYPLSRRDFKAKRVLNIFFIITMYFSGGMIPSFLIIRGLGLYNTMWALLLPGMFGMYNVVICRTYIQSSVPYEIQESAKIDGANDFRLMFQIVMPMCGPIISVLVLFGALGFWNMYMGPLIYLKDRSMYPLQVFLSEILVQNQQSAINSLMTAEELAAAQKQADQAELLKYAVVIVASLPFMILYPFMQKYVVKGVVVGSLKG